jgi:ABC-2 type transport system ATP-binding protein
MSTSPMRLADVGKRYGRGQPFVLRQVNATLSPGDLLHVAGTNGSGKSTLLRVVAGVTSASRGQVVGRPRSVGFVPERFPPAVRFSPRDYLRHLAAIRRTSLAESLTLLERLGGGGYVDTPMVELSKGSCQKVALAQGLMGPPGLLVLDEAWTGLDATAQAVLTVEVLARVEQGATVLVTDHVARSSAPQPTRRWLVADGAVTESVPDRQPAIRVVVLAGTGCPLDDLPGVLTCRPAPGALTINVLAECCDGLLSTALAGGWSVAQVRAAP